MIRKIAGGAATLVGFNLFILTFIVSDRLPEEASVWQYVGLLNLFIGGLGLLALGGWALVEA